MKLRRIAIERLAGIERPFELNDLGAGFNIIVGPNGIGKSRLSAAIRTLLWPARELSGENLIARASFEHHDAGWQVFRDGSRQTWQREGIDADSPTLPGERLEGCFFLGLRDLLDDSDHAGAELAGEIRKQMSGGFDLHIVAQRFQKARPPRIGRKESLAVALAEKAIRKAELVQADVGDREQSLNSLEARVAERDIAAGRLIHFERALALHGLRAEHAQRAREFADMPASLSNLDGKEIQRLAKLEESLAAKRSASTVAKAELERCGAAASESKLANPIEKAALSTWVERMEKLALVERDSDAARAAARGAVEAHEETRRLLGASAVFEFENDRADSLFLDDDFDLFIFLGESHRLESERTAVEERLRLLAGREFTEDAQRRLLLLRRAVEPLRAWLRAPDPELQLADGAVSSIEFPLIVAGIGLAIAGGLLNFAFAGSSLMLLIAAAGIGLSAGGLLALLWRSRFSKGKAGSRSGDLKDWRGVAIDQYPESMEAPSSWSLHVVREHLNLVEDELASVDASQKRSRDRGVEREQLQENLNGLVERSEALRARRETLVARLGLTEWRSDVEMVDVARLLDDGRKAAAHAIDTAARVRVLDESRREIVTGLKVVFAELGEAEPIDAASTRAALRSLEERDRQLRTAIVDKLRETKSLERFGLETSELEAEKAEIFRNADVELNDRAELARRIADLGRYADLRRLCTDLSVRVNDGMLVLEEAGESALAELDLAALNAEQVMLARIVAERDPLKKEIWEITDGARRARDGHEVEDAIARKSEILDALHDRRDEALAAMAGEFLVDQVQREHETNQMPRVLERAKDRFSAFTHHRYGLTVSSTESLAGRSSFRAVDAHSGEGLGPEQLSDGTRAQLILAARLSFAEEAEDGADLPLFLDEAMDHSDPVRFHAIARSLARMVLDDQRQIFYLSNDPTDVDRFRAAFDEEGCAQFQTIDLGQILRGSAQIAGPSALEVKPLAAVIDPGNHDAASYGAAIGVSSLEPRLGPYGQHVYYLLRDDLILLHTLLLAQIQTVGQCRNVLSAGSPLAKRIAGKSDRGAQLEARIALLETFCMAWREGRGISAGRAALEESDAVSAKYIDAFSEMLDELDGDSGELIAAIKERKDTRLRGSRKDLGEKLERFFSDSGYLDDRPILDESEIVERALGTPAANELSPKIAAELVHQWWTLSNLAGSAGGS